MSDWVKWLFLIIGAVISILFREIGNWAPRWSEMLIERRANRIIGTQGQSYRGSATARLGEIPGDWSKLVYTLFRLRPLEERLPNRGARGSEWPIFPFWLSEVINALPAVVGALSFTLAASVIFNIRWWYVVPLSIVWAAIILGLDRMILPRSILSSHDHSHPRRKRISAIAGFTTRLALSAAIALVVSRSLTLGIFYQEIAARLTRENITNPGIVDRLNVVANNSTLSLTAWMLFTLFLAIELLPIVVGKILRLQSTRLGRA